MNVNKKTGLVPVLFLKPATPYQVGDVAGFPPAKAKQLTSGDNPVATFDLDQTIDAGGSDDEFTTLLDEAAKAVEGAEASKTAAEELVTDRDNTIAELKNKIENAPKGPTPAEINKAAKAEKAKDDEIKELKKQLEELTKPDDEGVKENADGAGGGAK